MPEALGTIPPKSVQTGNSSETDGSSTARSSDDQPSTSAAAAAAAAAANQSKSPKTSPSSKKQAPQENQGKSNNLQNQKQRKSKGQRNFQKKPLKVNSKQKKAAVHELLSQIPRPFRQQITPSSSSTSLSTTRSTQPPTPRPTGLMRQNSIHQVNFRLRKSISQMDFKQSRRPGNIPIPSTPGRGIQRTIENHDILDANKKITNMCDIINKALTPLSSPRPMKTTPIKTGTQRSGGLVVTQSHTTLMQKMLHQDDYYYVLQERDPKVAGMRVFATIMLNAWRKRRDDVKRLTCEVADLKRGSIKAKNQLHVFNTLFRVEQKRNNDLNFQLKRRLEDTNMMKCSCESLTTSLISMKADKALLEHQLKVKEQEYDGVNMILTQTKSELFKAMTQQRELQANLSVEQRKVQSLDSQKNDLINEICDLNNEALQRDVISQIQLQEKDVKLDTVDEENNKLKEQLVKMHEYELKLDKFSTIELKYKAEVEELQSQVSDLKQQLAETLGCRVKTYWQQSLAYQKSTLQVMHWLAYYILPAAPPPKLKALPFGLSLQKAMSIVKR